jgi:hypothetical protein
MPALPREQSTCTSAANTSCATHEWPPHSVALIRKFRRLIADQIRKGLQEGEFNRSADASQVAAMLLGALDGTFLQAWLDPGLDPVSIGISL